MLELLGQGQLTSGVTEERDAVVRQRLVERGAPLRGRVHPLHQGQPLHQHRPGRDTPVQLGDGVLPVRVNGRAEQELPVAPGEFGHVVVGHVQVSGSLVPVPLLVVYCVERQPDPRVQFRRSLQRPSQAVLDGPLDFLIAAAQGDA